MELKGRIINFMGDSITWGAGVDSPEDTFVQIIRREQQLAEARNYGMIGTRIARQTGPDRWGNAFCDRFDQMEAQADVVVVFGGTNDYGHGDAKIGSFGDRVPTTFYGACHLLMEGLIRRYSTSVIVFVTPLHRAGENQPSEGNGLPMKAYVDIIRELARHYSLPLLDLNACAGIVPDIEESKAAYCPDGLHPNAAGHRIIASRLTGFLKSL